MTTENKAKYLVETYYNVWAFNNTFTNFKDAQIKKTKAFKMSVRSALIAVEEILVSEQPAYPNQYIEVGQVFTKYWQQVKEEIQKL